MLKDKTLSYINSQKDGFCIASFLGNTDLYEVRKKATSPVKSYWLLEDNGEMKDYFKKDGVLKVRVKNKYSRIMRKQQPQLNNIYFVFFDGVEAHHTKLI